MAGAVGRLGATNGDGEIPLEGEKYGGHPIFVVSSGHSIAFAVVPTPSSCDRPEDCRLPVTLRRPSAFAGLTIRNESGQKMQDYDYVVMRGGVPFPYPVLRAALEANGGAPEVAAVPLEVRGAAFLPEGAYALTTPRQARDPITKKDAWKPEIVGTFTLPSLTRVELLDRDGAIAKP
jgi:hypothetical protein